MRRPAVLAETPLPKIRESINGLRSQARAGVEVTDAALLRRLLLKHCVYGADVSPMGAEIATLSLWLASFVPGLSLAYLGRNVVVGNALIGVALASSVVPEGTFQEQSLRLPGLRGLSSRERLAAINELRAARPELADLLEQEQERVAVERAALASGEYASTGGDPDLYKYFCQRYRNLVREGGMIGVVLPRSAFVTQGSEGFRDWLYSEMTARRIDTLINRRLWAFERRSANRDQAAARSSPIMSSCQCAEERLVPIAFPEPELSTERYDLDAAFPDLEDAPIGGVIGVASGLGGR